MKPNFFSSLTPIHKPLMTPLMLDILRESTKHRFLLSTKNHRVKRNLQPRPQTRLHPLTAYNQSNIATQLIHMSVKTAESYYKVGKLVFTQNTLMRCAVYRRSYSPCQPESPLLNSSPPIIRWSEQTLCTINLTPRRPYNRISSNNYFQLIFQLFDSLRKEWSEWNEAGCKEGGLYCLLYERQIGNGKFTWLGNKLINVVKDCHLRCVVNTIEMNMKF